MDKSGRPVFNDTEGIFHFFLRQAESGGCSKEGKSCCRAKRHSENRIGSFYRLQAMATGKYNGIIYGSRMSLSYLFFQYPPPMVLLKLKFLNKKRGVLCLLPAAFLQMYKQQGDICRSNSGNAGGLPDSCRTYVAQLDDSLFF